MGDPSPSLGRDRNLLWRRFTGDGHPGGRVVHEGADADEFDASSVADLRATAARYPDDAELRRLISDLTRASRRFAELWESRAVGQHAWAKKQIDHPEVGRLSLDCDVMTVQGSDLKVVAYTAEPGSPDADKLALLRVVGLQTI
jgi:hypothetical protein